MRFPGGFEGVFESENLKKSPCGRGAIWGGSKRKNSVGAPKWAIHVKTLLNDLFKLIKCTFYLLALGLSDLKGNVVVFLVLLVCPGFWCFCPLTSHSARVANLGGGGENEQIYVQWPILSLVSVCAVPRWF